MVLKQVVVIYIACMVMIGGMCLFTFLQHWGNRSSRYFVALSGSILFWLIANTLYFVIPDPELALYIHNLKYIGVGFTSVFLLLYAEKALHKERLLQPHLLFLIFIIPSVTAFLLITKDYAHIFHTDIYIANHSTRMLSMHYGMWFWIQSAQCYLLALAAFFTILTDLRKTPRIYRMPLYMLLIGVAATVVPNLIWTVFAPSSLFDITLLCITFALALVFWAMLNSKVNDYLNTARDEIYNTMETAIFILDREHTLLDMNRTAALWCDKLSIKPLIGAEFLSMFEVDDLEMIKDQNMIDYDIVQTTNGQITILSLTMHDLFDKSNAIIGTYVSMIDNTRDRMLIRSLEYTSGMDSLTNLYNRRMYEQMMIELDTKENLPISVIMGDVNYLKVVNDRYGHEEGDRLLCAIAEIMLQAAPEKAIVARIGGDEYVMILPMTDVEGAQDVIDSIRLLAGTSTKTIMTPSISLGSATKAIISENLRELVEIADKKMYIDKQNNRRQRN